MFDIAIELEKVKDEVEDFSYTNYKIITQGCEKIVAITDTKKVVCFLRDKPAINKYFEQRGFIDNLSELSNASVPIYEYISKENGYIVENFIDGSIIDRAFIEKHSDVQNLIGNEIGKFLNTLHSMPKSGYHIFLKFLSEVRNDMIEGIETLSIRLSPREIEHVKIFLNEYYTIIEQFDEKCIIHGDFHFDNVMWNNTVKKLGVIDFGECCVGDPAIDFMWFSNGFPVAFVDSILEAYGHADKKIIERSFMHNRIYGLYDMIENIKGDPRKPDFEKGYKRFFLQLNLF